MNASLPSRRHLLLGAVTLPLMVAGSRLSAGATVGWLGLQSSQSGNIVHPEDFGARGDGVTNDHAALAAAAAAIVSAGGGTLRLRPGRTYLFGKQKRSQGPWLLAGESPLHFERVPVEIDLNGATLKLADGFRFGAFNPRTGARHGSTGAFVDRRYAAHLGHAIYAEDCPSVIVRNGSIDLNSGGQVIGGTYGDTGRQLPCYGVAVVNCADVLLEGVAVANSCADGILYHHRLSLEDGRAGRGVIRACRVDKVARNCLTITGGRGLLVENCDFHFAGMAPTGRGGSFGSSPKSCCDVEAEGTLVRDVTLRNCRLVAGAGSNTAFVADSGDSAGILLENCTLDGPVWTSRPGTRFVGCRVNGVFARVKGGAADPAENTQIINCTIVDRSSAADLSAYGSLMVAPGSGPGVVVAGCRIEMTAKALQIGGYRFTGNEVICRWRVQEHPAGGPLVIAGQHADLTGSVFRDEAAEAIGGPILIVTDGTERIPRGLVAPGSRRIQVTRA